MYSELKSKLSSKDSYKIQDAIDKIFNATHLNIKDLELARVKAMIEFIKITKEEYLALLPNQLVPLLNMDLINSLSQLEEELFPEIKLLGSVD